MATDDSGARRGLPRRAGGEAGGGVTPPKVSDKPDTSRPTRTGLHRPGGDTSRPALDASPPPTAAPGRRASLPRTRTVSEGSAAPEPHHHHRDGAKVEHPAPQRIGPFTKQQWARSLAVGVGLVILVVAAITIARWLLSLPAVQDFLVDYPGEYHLTAEAPVGIPGWLGWQHFFNVFFMVLIVRSGLQVRYDKRPAAFWTPRGKSSGKISLSLWFHQSLDLLWLANGVIFVVLLFTTGQWVRIVPTSWEVFPNALSAMLQYASLDWPTENGWVNYNSLQQLAYFTTVFIAAPLAAITGARMTNLWPANAKFLSKVPPVEWARAVHFPVMLYFVLFTIVHVALVLATAALRNLNHMYASLGSENGVAYADNWAGFLIFVTSLFVIASVGVAARPLVLAPIARLFGSVSTR